VGKFDCIEVIDDLAQATLHHVFVEKDKEKTMMTSAHHSIYGICEEFGKYVKFVVKVGGGGEAAASSRSVSSIPNAFTIMAIAQRQLQNGDNGVPFTISVKTNKDKLFIDLVPLMKELGVKWLYPNAFAKPFLKKLCEILWYLDGHHSTLSEHAPKVPLCSPDSMATTVLRSTSIAKKLYRICVLQSFIHTP
jgi:hypothetical protein